MKKGILLIALGHVNYFRMAVNLAASIKSNEPEMKIAIATDREINYEYDHLFDNKISVPDEAYVTEGKLEFIKAKTWMYEFSPFAETIFLDVDMIMLRDRKLSSMFDKLKDIDWTIANTGEANVSIWADITKVKEAYKTDNPFYNYHSEFVYFKKKPVVKKYFDKVRKVFDNPKAIAATVFGGARLSDELSFQIASMVMEYYPHEVNFLPTYWFGRTGKSKYIYPYQIGPSYLSYSVGGHIIPKNVKDNYNNLVSYFFTKLGLQSPYMVNDKKSFLPERNKI